MPELGEPPPLAVRLSEGVCSLEALLEQVVYLAFKLEVLARLVEPRRERAPYYRQAP